MNRSYTDSDATRLIQLTTLIGAGTLNQQCTWTISYQWSWGLVTSVFVCGPELSRVFLLMGSWANLTLTTGSGHIVKHIEDSSFTCTPSVDIIIIPHGKWVVFRCFLLELQTAHAAKCGEVNNENEEEALYTVEYLVQSWNLHLCYGQGHLLVEAHPNVVERRCLMDTRNDMEILPGVLFYIYFQ